MPFYSPLRYPGGKRRLTSAVTRLLEENDLTDIQYAEPFAGGASVAIGLLLEEHASAIHINDLSRPVYAFWYSVLNETSDLCRRFKGTEATMREWSQHRAVYDNQDSADLVDLGLATLFLNRTNRSGILSGGVVGGKQQTGRWSMNARFSQDEVIRRIERISRYRNRIHLYQLDALAFVQTIVPSLTANAFVFLDPPYVESGDKLYLNPYAISDHKKLAAALTPLEQPWIVTYDYAAVRYDLYQSHRRMVYDLSYTAGARYSGKEVMFFSDGLRMPSEWLESTTFSLRPTDSRYPVYGLMEVPVPQGGK